MSGLPGAVPADDSDGAGLGQSLAPQERGGESGAVGPQTDGSTAAASKKEDGASSGENAGAEEDGAFQTPFGKVVAQQVKTTWMSVPAFALFISCCSVPYATGETYATLAGTLAATVVFWNCTGLTSETLARKRELDGREVIFAACVLPFAVAVAFVYYALAWEWYLDDEVNSAGDAVALATKASTLGGLLACVDNVFVKMLTKSFLVHRCTLVPSVSTLSFSAQFGAFLAAWCFALCCNAIVAAALTETAEARMLSSLAGMVILKIVLRVLWMRLNAPKDKAEQDSGGGHSTAEQNKIKEEQMCRVLLVFEVGNFEIDYNVA